MKRRDFFIEQEAIINEKWGKTRYEADAPADTKDNQKKKYFVTFPFPYMNGRLHLGHVYTLLKADIMARHHETLGYNVLFPFGYHLTGIPITAAAARLKEELTNGTTDNQKQIMIKMGIDESEVAMFTDPVHWTKYFPQKASIIDLPMLGCAIDYRRSFITTDSNPHFDSFVQWQISKLHSKNLIKFGKKLVIYSAKDKQPCSAADRSIGEDVDIRQLKIALVKENNRSFFVTFDPTAPSNSIVRSKLAIDQNNRLIVYQGDKLNVYMKDDFLANLCHQIKIDCNENGLKMTKTDTEYFELMEQCDLGHGSGFYTSDPNLTWIDYYEPESLVVSRSGDRCVVAETDQWYIMYDDPVWRQSVYDHISQKVHFVDDIVKSLMLKAVSTSHPWPFSRSMGLGTKIPFDGKYLVDSLSDSTIYTAYYTISHLVKDLPVECLCDNVWESIFYNLETVVSKSYPELFNRTRREFNYWYPLDLRVSGKDLISNHLTMMFFNHWAIFGANFMPKSVYVNGHILINGEKMSKGKGNFVTLEQAVKKYGSLKMRGASATRLVAACAGDDINDGNFNKTETDTAVLSMYGEVQNWAKFDFGSMRTGEYSFIDHLNLVMLSKIVTSLKSAYDKIKIRDVVNIGFHQLQSVRNAYKNPHLTVFKLYLQTELAGMYPIIPHWAEYLSTTHQISTHWPTIPIDPIYEQPKSQWQSSYCELINHKLSKLLSKEYKKKRNPTSVIITINNNIHQYLDEILSYNNLDNSTRKLILSGYTDKKMQAIVIGLITHMEKYGSVYGFSNLATWLSADNSDVIQSYLSVSHPNLDIQCCLTVVGAGDPLNPIFTIN